MKQRAMSRKAKSRKISRRGANLTVVERQLGSPIHGRAGAERWGWHGAKYNDSKIDVPGRFKGDVQDSLRSGAGVAHSVVHPIIVASRAAPRVAGLGLLFLAAFGCGDATSDDGVLTGSASDAIIPQHDPDDCPAPPPPPPPPPEPEPPPSSVDQVIQCLSDCITSEVFDTQQSCIVHGHPDDEMTECLYPLGTHCKGAWELCSFDRITPSGPFSSWCTINDPHFQTDYCLQQHVTCMQAWETHEPANDGASLQTLCLDRGYWAATFCREDCFELLGVNDTMSCGFHYNGGHGGDPGPLGGQIDAETASCIAGPYIQDCALIFEGDPEPCFYF